ncbi:MAG: ATP-binding cassette domain-containing protein [Caldilineaceae bacterium]
MSVYPGEVMCPLGDNGAGKSTLIKTLSGVH